MIEFVTPTREVEPTSLEFRSGNSGIVFYPDGDLLIFWGEGDDFDERKFNIFNEENFKMLFDFVYKNDPMYRCLESKMEGS